MDKVQKHNSFNNYTVLSGILSPRHGMSSGCSGRDTEGSCKYIE